MFGTVSRHQKSNGEFKRRVEALEAKVHLSGATPGCRTVGLTGDEKEDATTIQAVFSGPVPVPAFVRGHGSTHASVRSTITCSGYRRWQRCWPPSWISTDSSQRVTVGNADCVYQGVTTHCFEYIATHALMIMQNISRFPPARPRARDVRMVIGGAYSDTDDEVDILRNVNRAADVSNRFFSFIRDDAAETGTRVATHLPTFRIAGWQ